MKKKLFLILGITTFLIISALFGYINASKINLTDFSVTYLDITDEQLPESFKDKTIIFISDLEYGTFFKEGAYPARSCVEVARLPKDALVEIEVVAEL